MVLPKRMDVDDSYSKLLNFEKDKTMRASYTLTTPPTWKKDAVPSAHGWRDPNTGELLVSIPGGNLPIIDETVSCPVLSENVPETALLDERVQECKVIDETEKENNVITESPKPTRKPRKKKEVTNAA